MNLGPRCDRCSASSVSVSPISRLHHAICKLNPAAETISSARGLSDLMTYSYGRLQKVRTLAEAEDPRLSGWRMGMYQLSGFLWGSERLPGPWAGTWDRSMTPQMLQLGLSIDGHWRCWAWLTKFRPGVEFVEQEPPDHWWPSGVERPHACLRTRVPRTAAVSGGRSATRLFLKSLAFLITLNQPRNQEGLLTAAVKVVQEEELGGAE